MEILVKSTQNQRTLTTAEIHNATPSRACTAARRLGHRRGTVFTTPLLPSEWQGGFTDQRLASTSWRHFESACNRRDASRQQGHKPRAGKGTWRHLQTTRLQPPFFSTGLPHLGQGLVLAASQLLVSLSSWIFCLHLAHLDQHHASFSKQPSAGCAVAIAIQFAIALPASVCIPRLCQRPAMYWSHCCPGSSASTCPPGQIIPSVNTQSTHLVLRAHNTLAHACWRPNQDAEPARWENGSRWQEPVQQCRMHMQIAGLCCRCTTAGTRLQPSRGGCPQNIHCSTAQSY